MDDPKKRFDTRLLPKCEICQEVRTMHRIAAYEIALMVDPLEGETRKVCEDHKAWVEAIGQLYDLEVVIVEVDYSHGD